MVVESSLHQQLEAVLLPEDFLLEWRETDSAPSEASRALQQATFQRFHEGGLAWLFHLGFAPTEVAIPESLEYWRAFAADFAKELALTPDLETLRHKARIEEPDSERLNGWLDTAPLCAGVELLCADRLLGCWRGLNEHFSTAVGRHDGSVESFLHTLKPDLELAGRVFFHLVENSKGAHPFAFMATYSTQPNGDGRIRHLPLKNAIREFNNDREKLLQLLAAVYKAARTSELLKSLLGSGKIFQPLGFDQAKALTFLRETPLYEASGIRCRIPNWWKNRRGGTKLSLSVGDKRPSQLGIDAITSCVPGLIVDGQPVSEDEARQLLEQSDGLVLIKNKWVELDGDKLKKTLEAYEKAKTLMADGMTLGEALRLLLDPNALDGGVAAEASVSFGDWLQEVTAKLRDPNLVRQVEPSTEFQAELRPYQQLGLNWLAFLDSLGFGACLADDMGLGKTIQVLGLLDTLRRDPEASPSLLVVPASLIGNWQDEIERFLPALDVLVAHASSIGDKAREGVKNCELRKSDLVITTYGMVHRAEWLREVDWRCVILDEAQAIKNPGTRQTRAVKTLRSRNRLALTGTPVENRLDDLWSLFDFLNPGLLGSASEFKKTAKTIHTDPEGYARLRRVVGPYILRRLKTDRDIIADLPDKIEMKTYARLGRRQTVLYREMLKQLQDALEDSEGIQRKGLVLASLLKFKQICNHPSQYTGDGEFKPADSGKFERLREICETVGAKHERLLVFTQFREMIDPLDAFLAEIFGHPGLHIHGGVSVKARRQRVEAFQTSRDYIPYMVLSVKAAGVGLNLARANHVVHFDRWWNPAVENQATDRAFRIGQTRNVMVHKFVCEGTVEERIDRMIEDKAAVSEQVIPASSGENWITEMSNAELNELFTLRT
jgi:superfamily II DNA or RNA helicase